MQADLAYRFVKVTEAAAIASARATGQGRKEHADHQAVEAMRQEMETIPMRGRIVIGEGERDEAPMLYIGEEVGACGENDDRVDIAVDPLEGTNLCAKGAPGAMAVLAAAPEGGLLNAPDSYMNKLVVGPRSRGRVDIGAPVEDNLKAIADSLDRDVDDVLVVVMDRPRHDELIRDIRAAGARIRLITDGDLSPAISACIEGTAVHAVMGIGGAPEGVLAAAAIRCLGGDMQGQLVEYKEGDRARAEAMGITDFDKIRTAEMLAPGERIILAATAVTDGELMKGISFWGGGCRTNSIVMGTGEPRRVRFIDTVHLEDDRSPYIKL
ncbi:MAG: class II fructose-bisphosphatase [Planctomycetota bacterium]|nr:class II fructose-bisphosphatase [Planctomycetota bacterium]